MKYRDLGLPEIEGWMYLEELDWLYEQATNMYSILEIGCWKGRSTQSLLSGCKGPVFVIDTFHGSWNQPDKFQIAKTEDIFKTLIKNVGHFPNLNVIKMRSDLASQFFKDKTFDMIFIDGCHHYDDFKLDYVSWFPKCKKLFCGHDKDEGGVPKVLRDLHIKFKKPCDRIWSFTFDRKAIK